MENKRTLSPGEPALNVNKKRNMQSSPDLDDTILEDNEDQTSSIEKTIQAALEKLLPISLEKIIPVIIQNSLKEITDTLLMVQNENALLKKEVSDLHTRVASLETRCEAQDQENRANSLILFNDWAESPNESVQIKTKSYVNDVLHVNINDTDIVKCHRLGRTDRNNRSARPRPILVKFQSTSLKSELLNARRKIRNFSSADFPSPVFINEDLTDARRAVYARCRNLKKEKRILDCWTQNGRVLIKTDTNTILPVSCMDDVLMY